MKWRPLDLGGLAARRSAAWTLTIVLALASAPANAATWYVGGTSSPCSDVASGTPSDPYCSISAALADHHDPGTTLVIGPGIYRERVLIPASGTAGAPIELVGLPGAIVDGTDDFSDVDLWQLVRDPVWLAAGVTWSPSQVFVDSVRFKRWDGAPEDTPVGRFAYVSGAGLYLNVGGENPGLHAVLVGRRPYGVQMSHRAWISIRNLTFVRQDLKGVYMTQASHDIVVSGNTFRDEARYGVQADTCDHVTIADNVVTGGGDRGIVLLRGTTSSEVLRNESAFNSQPLVRQANGIYMFRAPGNLIADNRCHDNQDTGIQ